ncbi:hypothetical protein IC617_08450 [Neiella sp. HB171785]|uniref:Uncharacterized protein n=1 Tax=Neiella litorisoli TaxID=2771431 RepID=A0A8J6R2S9_9GAMM|nr:hypothetical protein [Neiella litorisoli]MBD1389455.1 hypothetical protein [Neiella litorisoli]
MNIGFNFHEFNGHRALVFFLTIFIKGWLVAAVAMAWYLGSNFRIQLMFSPVIWFIPLFVAIPGAVYQGIRCSHHQGMATNWRAQPRWFQYTMYVAGALLGLGVFVAPMMEAPPRAVAELQQSIKAAGTSDLQQSYSDAMADGAISRYELGVLRRELFRTAVRDDHDKQSGVRQSAE